MEKLIIDCISDTHNQHKKIKLLGGDILIHSGDCSGRGSLQEVISFLDWFADQDYSYFILVAGNHDWAFEQYPDLMADECKRRDIILLNDSGTTVEDIKIYGSPVQPWFYDWAFNRHRGAEIKKHWDLIPNDTDVLVTHGPPHKILDMVSRSGRVEYVGCEDLSNKIAETTIKLHVFGHIHEGSGIQSKNGKLYVNASSVDEMYSFDTPGYRRIIRDKDGTYHPE